MKTMTIEEFHATLRAQGVPRREDAAFKCPICFTVQSIQSLINAGAGKTAADVEKFAGFSCVGRFTGSGPYKQGATPGRGCDWSLGGLLRLHCLEVITSDGEHHPAFEPASDVEAQCLAHLAAKGDVYG